MKNLRQIQFVLVAILLTVMFEGLLTVGLAFDFSRYNLFIWIVQVMIYTLAVVIALRVAEED
jgi:hypothetical protein